MSKHEQPQLSFPEAEPEKLTEPIIDPASVPVVEPEGQKGLPSRAQVRADLSPEQISLQAERNASGIADAVAALDRINQRKP